MRTAARAALGRFARDTRAAVGIAAALLTVGTVAGAALVVDHVWLYDQRDVLKTAAEAASIAATLDIDRQLAKNPSISDADLEDALEAVAKRYVEINLAHLPAQRLEAARQSLDEPDAIALGIDRAARTVVVTVQADLGGTLFSRWLPLLGNYEGPGAIAVKAGVDADSSPAEVILAIDTSTSMLDNLQGDVTDGPPSLAPGQTCSGGGNRSRECSRMEIVKRAALALVDILEPDKNNRVAVGVVPWHVQVRLDTNTADTWVNNGWADYPTHRRYDVPYLNCNYSYSSNHGYSSTCTNLPGGVEEALPASAPRAWKRCLDEDRVDAGIATLPSVDKLFDPPSRNAPFAQGYSTSGFGIAYQCQDPGSADFPADFKTQVCYMPPPGISSDVLRQSKIYSRSSQYDCRPGTGAILPLSTEPTKIGDTIKSLRPVGGLTYSALGVLWGQRLLTPSWKSAWGGGAHPVGPGDPDADEVRKAIVLLTDGNDTYCGLDNHSCKDSPVGIARADACDAAKEAGTEIFVVAAMDPSHISTPFESALRDCSSEGDDEYPAGTRRPGGSYVFLNNHTPENLRAAFADIADQLRTLRRIL